MTSSSYRAVFTWLSKVIEELVWFWFYYALWLASVFTLVLVLRQSSENRSISVIVNRWLTLISNISSGKCYFSCGISQDSVLSPLLFFFLYVNDFRLSSELFWFPHVRYWCKSVRRWSSWSIPFWHMVLLLGITLMSELSSRTSIYTAKENYTRNYFS